MKKIGRRKRYDPKKLIGRKFGDLTVIKYAGLINKFHSMFCECKCGKTSTTTIYNLISGHAKSCGCRKIRGPASLRLKLRKHARFSFLRVVKFSHTSGGNSYWIFKCDCGKIITRKATHVTLGSCRSCGCKHYVHGKDHPMFKGYEGISGQVWRRMEDNARDRNLEFNISIEFAWKLLQKQKGRCALSGIDLLLSSWGGSSNTASLDRIDSSQGYIVGNVQWVHKTINFMKQAMSDNEFIAWCKCVASFRRRIKKQSF